MVTVSAFVADSVDADRFVIAAVTCGLTVVTVVEAVAVVVAAVEDANEEFDVDRGMSDPWYLFEIAFVKVGEKSIGFNDEEFGPVVVLVLVL